MDAIFLHCWFRHCWIIVTWRLQERGQKRRTGPGSNYSASSRACVRLLHPQLLLSPKIRPLRSWLEQKLIRSYCAGLTAGLLYCWFEGQGTALVEETITSLKKDIIKAPVADNLLHVGNIVWSALSVDCWSIADEVAYMDLTLIADAQTVDQSPVLLGVIGEYVMHEDLEDGSDSFGSLQCCDLVRWASNHLWMYILCKLTANAMIIWNTR